MTTNEPHVPTQAELDDMAKARETARYGKLYTLCMVADEKSSLDELLGFMADDGDLSESDRDRLSKPGIAVGHVLKIRCDLQARQALLSEMPSKGNSDHQDGKPRRAKIDLTFKP